jgi:hypothetical protein
MQCEACGALRCVVPDVALSGTNATKQACPLTNGTAVPAIAPVSVPAITSLQGGAINVGAQTPAPTQIKVRGLQPAYFWAELQAAGTLG